MASGNKIQETQEALVKSHMRTIKALKDSLQELQTQGLIRPFRISLAVSQEQEEQIKALTQQGKSAREIAAKTGVSKTTVSRRAVSHGTKKASNVNGKSVPRDRGLQLALTVAAEAVNWTNVTEEIVSAANAVAQAWRETADFLARQLKGDDNG